MKFAQINLATGKVEGVVNAFGELSSTPAELAKLGLLQVDEAVSDTHILESAYDTRSGEFKHVGHLGAYEVYDFSTACVVDTRSEEYYRRAALETRATLLMQSDWTQLPDVPLSTKEAWATYRQVLRDITDQPGFPENVVWPVPPQ